MTTVSTAPLPKQLTQNSNPPSRSNFMIQTLTNKIKLMIMNEEKEMMLKNKKPMLMAGQYKLDARDKERVQIDKLMKLKDQLEERQKL